MSFTPPIGTAEERQSGDIWPGRWFDATGYLTDYSYGFHTGADLNLNFPHFNTNAHQEVHAIGDGTVTFAKLFSTTAWGKIVVIDHGEVDGKPLFSRYGHVENILVSTGQTVTAGEPISAVGNGEGLFPYHLHFDISHTEILRTRPGHWPGSNRGQVLAHYLDPKHWLQAHVTDGITNFNSLVAHVYYIIATLGLRVREAPGLSAIQVGLLPFGTRVTLDDAEPVNQDSFTWARITSGMYKDFWLAMAREDDSVTHVSRNPPGS